YFYFLSRFSPRDVHDIPTHSHDPVSTFTHRLNFNVKFLSFLEITSNRLRTGLPFPHRAVPATGVTPEQENPVILHKAGIRFSAFRADDIVINISLNKAINQG